MRRQPFAELVTCIETPDHIDPGAGFNDLLTGVTDQAIYSAVRLIRRTKVAVAL
ncbi:hypothetical protein [Sinorhizobium medicae]|uniref:hypothetical protein n=1 Tax=Sinorhizobium medicae TaxID=110321 RepID=UPI00030C1FFB|nr:hypothetical protein [Sinorhizobium medicae]